LVDVRISFAFEINGVLFVNCFSTTFDDISVSFAMKFDGIVFVRVLSFLVEFIFIIGSDRTDICYEINVNVNDDLEDQINLTVDKGSDGVT
jgi:hypothetical protein